MIVKDSFTELRETNIWKYLNEIDSQYASRAISFVEHLTPVLKSIQEIFPFYTRHDAHHSYRVLKRMGEVIQPDCIKGDTVLSFTNIEAFLLICSAYAHDLGMAVFPNEEKQLLPYLDISIDSDWKSNLSLQNYVRNNHSVRGIDFIDHNLKTLKFPRHLVNHLDILMKAHNMSINELDSISNVRLAAGDKEIDIKQLACILCVADSLEFSETRIVDGVINLLADRIKNKEDKEALKSYQENMKHVCIGDNLAIGRDNRIVITGSFNDPEVLYIAAKKCTTSAAKKCTT
jgi:hypothetical protein